jgi:hypothetical protein
MTHCSAELTLSDRCKAGANRSPAQKQNAANPLDRRRLFGCGGRIRTYDLQVMSLTSYRAAPPREGQMSESLPSGIDPRVRAFGWEASREGGERRRQTGVRRGLAVSGRRHLWPERSAGGGARGGRDPGPAPARLALPPSDI